MFPPRSVRHNYEPSGNPYQQLLDLQNASASTAWTGPTGIPMTLTSRGTMMGNGQSVGVNETIRPKIDIYEDTENNLVSAIFELPGVSKDEVQIGIQSSGVLTVSTEIKQPQSVGQNLDNFAIRERRVGLYSRTIQLPNGVKDEDIKASMENGVLIITFPKSAPELPAKRIVIS